MKRVVAGILLVLFACTWASAESSVWKAHKGDSVIYLGGTFHLLRATDFPLPTEFDKAYKASEVVLFETDIGMLRDPSTQQKMLARAMYADGSTIDKHLSARAYGELSAYCTANGIPLKSLSQFKPSMLMATLTLMEFMKLGFTQQGVDMFYYGLAHKDKKVVKGLESIDEQINYVVSMADGDEDEFVTYSIRDMKDIREQLEALEDAWRKGDASRLNELMITELKTRYPKVYRKLVVDRNRNWLSIIDACKSPKTKFILVGTAHLVGPDGIIEALRQRGYTVDKL
jgi:uncharacterized protein YbaP (TraB family)